MVAMLTSGNHKAHLFGFERQLDEYLLQLLVDIVDAKLFESVLIENFEAVNVKNADCLQVLYFVLHCPVDALLN